VKKIAQNVAQPFCYKYECEPLNMEKSCQKYGPLRQLKKNCPKFNLVTLVPKSCKPLVYPNPKTVQNKQFSLQIFERFLCDLEETNCCYSFFPRKSEIAKRRRGDLIALR
jgi:hypothetical protein